MCKLEMHRGRMRGYIAMIAVNKACRGRGIAKTLATRAIAGMVEHGAEEVIPKNHPFVNGIDRFGDRSE